MKLEQVEMMKDEAVREYLKRLITALDAEERSDFFGTEGWRHFLMGED
ncbi:hypothetical protein KAR91_31745 [Candidatus Pacearchaeota archaeon]|nr:hypothetical protein [Candidatus Pacearchaeota archaeon]